MKWKWWSLTITLSGLPSNNKVRWQRYLGWVPVQDGWIEKELDEAATEAKRRADGVCANTWNLIAELCQCIKVWKERHSQRDVETSHSQDGRSQTCYTRDDGPGPSHRKDSHPTREGCKQDGQVHCLSNKPNGRSHKLSPLHTQRHTVMDEETLVDVVAKSWQDAEHWEQLENDAAKHHREALDHMIQAAADSGWICQS